MGCCAKLITFFILIAAVSLGLLLKLQNPKIAEARFNLLVRCDELLSKHGISSHWLESLDSEYAKYKTKRAEINSKAAKAHAESAFNEESTTFTLPKCLKNEFKESDLKNYKHISLLGHVFDVSINPEMYGVNGGYNEFTGHEGTHHYVFGPTPTTSTETEGLKGLTLAALDELINWFKFYTFKYECIGFMDSSYMNKNGEPKKYLHELIRNWVEARKLKAELTEMFPTCHSVHDGTQNIQSCGTKKVSDGKEVQMFPRQLQEPGKLLARCACVLPEQINHPRIRALINCDPEATKCAYTPRNQNETDWSGVEFRVKVNL